MTDKLAIVGMDAFFGTCHGLDNFQRSIYEATQHFISVPPTRYQDTQQKQNGESPLGSYIKDFEIDALHFKIPPHELDKYDPRQLLMLKVIDSALRDANLDQKAKTLQKVAVVTVIKDNLVQADNSELDASGKNSFTEQKNLIFSKISALWNISGPNFSVCVEENSVFEALEIAKMLLVVGSADTVVVGAVNLTGDSALCLDGLANINTGKLTLSYDCNASGTMVGEGAGAVVLKRYEKAKEDSDRIYAVIDAVVLTHLGSATPTQSAIQSCHKAFEQAKVKATDIGYLELFASGDKQQDNAEIESLIQAYQISDPNLNVMNCAIAIGSVKTNIGHTYLASGIASLIKTALCLYNRYIPATPQWSSPKRREWENSPFYVATESIPWFLTKGQTKRTAAINSQGNNGTYAHLVLSEDLNQQRSNKSKEQTPFYLFPIAANDQSALLEQLDALEQTIENSSSLSTAASQTFAAFQRYSQLTYALAIVGHDKDELIKEIQRGRKGIPNAFASGKEWKSPKGSYFTPKPLGKHGIAFVYPGAFNSYLGMGRKLFNLFPKIHERAASFVSDASRFFRDKQLYPRSLNQLSKRQLEELEAKFLNDSLGVQVSGTGFAVLLTFILRDYFCVQPQAAFGYSMGEGTMLYALNVWTNGEDVSNFVHSSPIFQTRLLGAKNVLCDYWGLGHQESEALWHNYVLMAPPSAVMSCLEQESQVYLTNINTKAEVVIGGEPQACLRVIKALNCEAFRAPTDLVLHCEPMASEYDEVCKLNTSPFQNVPEINFYSSANYDLMTLDKEEVTHTVSQGFSQRVDFPRLVNRVYEDGAKIFIDLGPGSTCSRWIAENLGSQEHVSISLNRRGVDDYVAIVRALGQLLSHRASVDLSPLYSEIPETNTKKTLVKTVTLNQFPLIPTKDKKSLNIVLDEADVLEFADGKVSHVFGKEFESIDSHARRVRLPSLPYLFVSRVNKLEGNRNEYDSGFIQTEYDVPEDAWYSVDGQIPVGIYEEASQGLLTLLGYLGTDFESKGERSFRLLDFTATFCCEQPKEIKTLVYNVKINSYVRTTYNLLVFFSAECFIGEKLFLKISGG